MDIEIILAAMGIVGGVVGAWGYRGRKSIDIKYEREVGVNAQIKGLVQVITSQAEVNREQQVINSSMQGKMDAILEADRANVQTLIKEGYDLGGKILQRIDDTHPKLTAAVIDANRKLLSDMGGTIVTAIDEGIRRANETRHPPYTDPRWKKKLISPRSKTPRGVYIYSRPDYNERPMADPQYYIVTNEVGDVIEDAATGFHVIRVERDGAIVMGWVLTTSVLLLPPPYNSERGHPKNPELEDSDSAEATSSS